MNTKLKNDQKNGVEKDQTPETVKLEKAPVPQPASASTKTSVDDRIQQVEEIRSLTIKRQRAKDTLNNLRAFHFASDDSCELTIVDGQGQRFTTGNTNLITILKDHLEKVLAFKIAELDDQILAFKF